MVVILSLLFLLSFETYNKSYAFHKRTSMSNARDLFIYEQYQRIVHFQQASREGEISFSALWLAAESTIAHLRKDA